MTPIGLALFACVMVFVGCAGPSGPAGDCRARQEACLKRCYAADPDGAEPSMFGNPEYPARRCDQRCGCTGAGSNGSAKKAPATNGPPSITGP